MLEGGDIIFQHAKKENSVIDINELDESKKYLIISDACYRNVLWSLKSSHPQMNFKLITKE